MGDNGFTVGREQKIIVFGGTGFLGSALLGTLSTKNIVLITREPAHDVMGCVNILYSDIGSARQFGNFDLALDFSSHVSVEDFLDNPQTAFLDNIDILIKNIRCLSDIGFTGKYVYISTDRALVNVEDNLYANDVSINCDPYGASKLIGELIVKYAGSLGWTIPTVIRFPNLYGSGQRSKQLIPSILVNLNQGTHDIEIGSKSGSRNYLHVNDAVEALKRYVTNPIDIQNLCISGEEVKIATILESFIEILKSKYAVQITFSERHDVSPRAKYSSPPLLLDDSIFRDQYKWEPKIKFYNGIQLIIERQFNGK